MPVAAIASTPPIKLNGKIDHHQPAVGAPSKRDEQNHEYQCQRETGKKCKFGARLVLGVGRAGELDEEARGQSHRRCDALLGVENGGLQSSAADIEVHGDATLAAVVFDAVAIRRGCQAGQVRQRHLAERTRDHQLAQLLRPMPQLIRDQQDGVDGARTVEGLSESLSRKGRLNRPEHVLRPQPHRRQRLRLEFDRNGGRAALAFELQIHDARFLAERSHDLIPDVVQRIQVFAEHLDGDLRRAAGQALADAVAEEGHHLALDAGGTS